MSEDPATYDLPVTPHGRVASSFLRRRWPEFAVEFVLIIAGILTALAIDGWVQEYKDRRTEAAYLQLLSEDLTQIEDQLRSFAAFEEANLETAVSLYTALAPDNPAKDLRSIQDALGALSVRQTVHISSATYTDLQSTGSLQIIGNQALRQEIIRYFAQIERLERVIEKNNTAFVDDIYMSSLVEAGVTISFSASNQATIGSADAILSEALSGAPPMPSDAVLLLAPDAPSWDNLRRLVVFRARISAAGMRSGNRGMEWTNALRAAIEEELRNPI